MNKINKNRQKIDALDEQIQNLLNTRAEIAQIIGNSKKEFTQNSLCYVPEREEAILRTVIARNTGPLSNEALQKIYQQIIASCRGLEKKLTIAFLGPLGTFSHQATLKCFGTEVNLLPLTSIKEASAAVEHDNADCCIVPIENSCEGIVTPTLDQLGQSNLAVCNEILLPVHHYLLSRSANTKEITQIYSHPQALAQCQQWLEKNFPHAALFPAKSSAQACLLAANEVSTAAIAGELALSNHNLNVLAKHIEDEPNNTTRFYVMGKHLTKPSGQDKTSMLITIPHKPGALANTLNKFATNGVNLTLLQSRPSKKQIWEYMFFLEMEGHQNDAPIKKTLHELNNNQALVKILGSFPRTLT